MKQKTLFKVSDYNSHFGGSINSKHARRPLSKTLPMHLVLRCDVSKTGSLLYYKRQIELYFSQFSDQFGVKIYKKAIVSNHAHIVALFQSRLQYRQFIRALTGAMAKSLKIKFTFRPWSRLLNWGRSLQIAIKYTLQNQLEALGLIPYCPRRRIAPKSSG